MKPVERALERAENWLRSTQSADGSWHDFWTPSGASDEWVTAYVGAALALSTGAASQASVRAAWHYLATKQRADGGWGYCAGVPSDADSTTWGLVLAQHPGMRDSPHARYGYDFLDRAKGAGGIVTYPDVDAIRSYVQRDWPLSFRGWSAPHACVTGAAAQLSWLWAPLFEDVLAAQQSDGSWRSYWWFDDAYATAMAAIALAHRPCSRSVAAIARACQWAGRRLTGVRASSSFSLSLLLLILAHGARAEEDVGPYATALAAMQETDGHWRGSARLRIPSPDVTDPGTVASWRRWWGSGSPFDIYSIDLYGTFTTATAYSALARLSRTARTHAFAL